MQQRDLLVAYATQKGTARDIAELIAETAPSHGWHAEIAPVDQFEKVALFSFVDFTHCSVQTTFKILCCVCCVYYWTRRSARSCCEILALHAPYIKVRFAELCEFHCSWYDTLYNLLLI